MMPTIMQNRDMLGRTATASLETTLELLHRNLPPCPGEKQILPLAEALGRICVSDIFSPENLPPYPRSTMDGYAVRSRDTFGASEKMPAYLDVKGEVRMGEYPAEGPPPGSCFNIATGGILPPGTDAVVMLEHTVAINSNMIEILQPVATGAHVISAGEDVAQNQILLPAGQRIRPQEIGLLAGVGLVSIEVFRKVKVGILATGDEIVPADKVPPPGKIRDMNSPGLTAQVKNLNADATFYGIAPDKEEILTGMVQEAMAANDIVLLSGSSSVGTRDLGQKVIELMGPPGIIIHGVSIKPGKPVIIARAGDTMIFGLPGHPVSAAFTFDLFVRPVIIHLSGLGADNLPKHRTINARLGRNISSASGRTDFVRVQIDTKPGGEYMAQPILGKSGALSTMVKAHGYIVIAEKLQGIKEGQTVEVKLFD